MVLVDTTIWSLAIRRRARDRALVEAWVSMVTSGTAALIGSIRQEILSGIQRARVFEAIRLRLSDFPYFSIGPQDYDQAARFFNTCRSRGVTATDMLVCAVAHHHDVPIFTTDTDFERYARYLPIPLHGLGRNNGKS